MKALLNEKKRAFRTGDWAELKQGAETIGK